MERDSELKESCPFNEFGEKIDHGDYIRKRGSYRDEVVAGPRASRKGMTVTGVDSSYVMTSFF